MNVEVALQGVTRLFLDTAPVIYHVERAPRYVRVVDYIFDRLDAETLAAAASPITLAECLIGPYRLGDSALQEGFFELLTHGPGTYFCPIDRFIARRSAELRTRYNLTLADALQVACALTCACDAFLTNDSALRRVTELSVLVLDELEPPHP
jgi:predicted nucleic acid-binding protein